MDCYVYWSIYLHMKSVQKLRQAHLPLIEKILGPIEYPWEITYEDYNPDWLRIVNFQNVAAPTSQEVILTVLKRAYTLADGWKIHGFNDMNEKSIRHVSGTWDAIKKTHEPPALADMMFELKPGRVDHKTDDGGWFIDDGTVRL